jgi:protein-arginine kinase activator protein McsA
MMNMIEHPQEDENIRLYVCKVCGKIMAIGHEWRKYEAAHVVVALPDNVSAPESAITQVMLDTCKNCMDFSEMLPTLDSGDMFT